MSRDINAKIINSKSRQRGGFHDSFASSRSESLHERLQCVVKRRQKFITNWHVRPMLIRLALSTKDKKRKGKYLASISTTSYRTSSRSPRWVMGQLRWGIQQTHRPSRSENHLHNFPVISEVSCDSVYTSDLFEARERDPLAEQWLGKQEGPGDDFKQLSTLKSILDLYNF